MSQRTKQIQHDLRMRRNRSNNRLHTCSYCAYKSTRLYNVQRHEGRIHSKRIKKICCGQILLSKDDYYIHCEKHHPETRATAITSRHKYKISRYSVGLNEEAKQLCRSKLKPRSSERILADKERKMQSQVSLSYKVTYNEMEDIPLKYFLTDHRLARHMKRLSSSSKTDKTRPPKMTKTQTISSEQYNEEMASENGAQEDLDSFDLPAKNLIDSPAKYLIDSPAKNLIDSPAKNLIDSPAKNLIDSPAKSLIDLPAKKMILRRFRKSTTRKFGIPLRDENNNNPSHANAAEATATATESVSLMQNYGYRSKNLKWDDDKENMPTFAFSFEQKIDIVLDSCITAPVVTQLQRDFLDSFDFDQYRIF